MLFLLIFPVLVAGFFACHIHPLHFYKLHRYEGQYLYLKSAELGLKCFFIGSCLCLIGHYLLPSELQISSWSMSLDLYPWLTSVMTMIGAEKVQEAQKMAWFFLLSISTFFSALILQLIGKLILLAQFRTWKTKTMVMGRILDDSPLEAFLFESTLKIEKHVMLSMDDRKVYVGKVINLGEPTETGGTDQDVCIIPVMSGYRDKDTLKVDFTTQYGKGSKIELILRQDLIVSATEFDFDSYEKFKAKEPKKEAAPSGLTSILAKLVVAWAAEKDKK